MAPSDDRKAKAGISDDRKAEADIYDRSEHGKEKTMKLLEQVGLRNGLILIDDIQECGYVKKTGFVWMKWKVERKFKAIGRLVQYETEISGYVEQHKKSKKKMKETKSKELRECITISEISIDDAASAVIGEKNKELREWSTISAALSGVKSKELREWINISESSIDDHAKKGNNKSVAYMVING